MAAGPGSPAGGPLAARDYAFDALDPSDPDQSAERKEILRSLERRVATGEAPPPPDAEVVRLRAEGSEIERIFIYLLAKHRRVPVDQQGLRAQVEDEWRRLRQAGLDAARFVSRRPVYYAADAYLVRMRAVSLRYWGVYDAPFFRGIERQLEESRDAGSQLHEKISEIVDLFDSPTPDPGRDRGRSTTGATIRAAWIAATATIVAGLLAGLVTIATQGLAPTWLADRPSGGEAPAEPRPADPAE